MHHKVYVWAALALGCGMLGAASGETLRVKAAGLSAELDGDGRGGVMSLKTAAGAELATGQAARLFSVTVSKRAQVPGEEVVLANTDAQTFEAEAGDGSRVTLTYSGFARGVESVVCTVRAVAGESVLRWGIEVTPAEGWVLEKVHYPCVTLAAPLGTSVEDDAAVVGSAKGGVVRKPGALKDGTWIGHRQPGNLAAQFGCYYDDRAGFYTAAEDARGFPKELVIRRTWAGVEFGWTRTCFNGRADTQAYDVVMAGFSGADGAPADWRDAADIYKEWALRQPWCATPFAQRADLPAWLKDAPAMVRFSRDWLADPERIERWLTEYWKKRFPEAPLIMAYWGWEKRGDWVTPDYFPVFPSDETFARLVARSRELGCHAFPWPSGYHWTLTYNKRSDGSFGWDDRARFDQMARPHAVHKRDGSMYLRTPSWLNGGDTACLCGGDPWTIRWWNEDICVPLAKLGCELVQIDQVVGADWPACYADGHGHPKGRGRWMTDAFNGQLLTMRDAMRKFERDAVVCFEEPNEWFNHIVGLQDYRNCETSHEWASVFNYLYHEFLPPFQSNPRGSDRVMNAHCAADGQMPHFVPTGRDLADEALANGGFEPGAGGKNALRGWSQVREYQGKVWAGQAVSDASVKRSGASSLRLLNADAGDIVQISQNVSADESGFAAGGKYRLSAWLKTGRMARPNTVNFAVFAPGLKGMGQGGQLKFPAAGSDWTRVSGEFTVPAGAEMLRIMIHVDGEAEAWVDDMTLEAVAADGSAKPVRYDGLSADARFMRNWVALYHGEGRPWLLNGRLLHPPRLDCASVERGTARDGSTPPKVPAVFHNAFRAPDGTEAVVLANATRERQVATLFWRDQVRRLTLEPDGIVLVRD